METAAASIPDILAGFTPFALNLMAGLILVGLFMTIYVWITPYHEFRLIKEGKVAPAVSFGGAVFGFVIPVASAIAHSVSFLDMVIWAIIALVVQIIVFMLLRIIFRDISYGIANDKLAPAILLGVLATAAGIINAASMTY